MSGLAAGRLVQRILWPQCGLVGPLAGVSRFVPAPRGREARRHRFPCSKRRVNHPTRIGFSRATRSLEQTRLRQAQFPCCPPSAALRTRLARSGIFTPNLHGFRGSIAPATPGNGIAMCFERPRLRGHPPDLPRHAHLEPHRTERFRRRSLPPRCFRLVVAQCRPVRAGQGFEREPSESRSTSPRHSEVRTDSWYSAGCPLTRIGTRGDGSCPAWSRRSVASL